jgi:hypothetical protein
MNEVDARRIFDNKIALCKVFGGDLRKLCLEKGMQEQVFDKLFMEHQHMSAFIDKHDLEGNVIID